MAWYDSLVAQGAVPTGTTKKVIPAGQQEAGYYQTDPLSRLMRTLQGVQIDQQAKAEKVKKENDKKLDIYKTLRDQGYDPKKAYDAATKGILPAEAPGETMAEQKAAAELTKTKAETEKIQKGLVTKTKAELEDEIMNKVARGGALATGEQKIYDEVIKKQRLSSGDSVDDIIEPKSSGPGAVNTGEETMIPVFGPDGSPGFVPKSKLAAALAKGFRKRSTGQM